MPLENIESHSLLPDLLRPGGTVVDCGANLGTFSRVMVERFGVRVFAFEASPAVFARIPGLPGLVARNIAVCGNDGVVQLAIDDDITRTAVAGEGRTGSGAILEVEGRTLPRLLAEAGIAGDIEVLKLDIEGAELGVIDSMSDNLIRRIGQITIEFHDFLGYHSRDDVNARVERIKALGFRELWWSRTRNTADVLLVNVQRLGVVRYMFEHNILRPARAVGRRVSRILNDA